MEGKERAGGDREELTPVNINPGYEPVHGHTAADDVYRFIPRRRRRRRLDSSLLSHCTVADSTPRRPTNFQQGSCLARRGFSRCLSPSILAPRPRYLIELSSSPGLVA